MKRTPLNGIIAARQFGAEWQANPGSSRRDYLDSAAYYFDDDKETFADLSPEEKIACRKAFEEGVNAEKSHQ